jgi:hypothetical protein
MLKLESPPLSRGRVSAAVACLRAAAKADSNWSGIACAVAHDVSIPAGFGGVLRRGHLPSKVSIMSMRPPQQGQMRTGIPKAGASALSASPALDTGAAMASKARMVARFSARAPLARSP